VGAIPVAAAARAGRARRANLIVIHVRDPVACLEFYEAMGLAVIGAVILERIRLSRAAWDSDSLTRPSAADRNPTPARR
jgi:hypothetical protein